MASIASITAAAYSVTCDAKGGGVHLFTVKNITGGVLRCGIRVQVDDPCQESWMSIEGETERELAEQATDQVKVRIQAPADTLPGSYRFRLLVYSTASPGEDFTESETAGVEIKPMAKPTPPAPEDKRFSWWIPISISALLLVGIATWVFWPDGRVEIPAVEGLSLEQAKQKLGSDQFDIVTRNVTDDSKPGTVLKQSPKAEDRVLPDETSGKVIVSLDVAIAKIVVPAPSTNLERWVAASGGTVPPGAVRGGTEHPPGMQALYVCRANFNNGTHPGKIRPGFGGCNIGWGGTEHAVANYEVLVGGEFLWVADSGGQVPSGAYQGGVEHPPGNQKLYICRAAYNNGTHPGKVRPGFSGCNISWGGKELAVTKYEVLVK